MKKYLSHLLLPAIIVCTGISNTQCTAQNFFEDNNAFFLKYLKQDKFDIDTSAEAVVIYQYDCYDHRSDFILRHKVHKVIRIINKKGIERANVTIMIPGYKDGHNMVNDLKGYTYNLDGEHLTRQKLEVENTSTDKDKRITEKKFSMPAVREGSVIDYSYEIEGDLGNIIARWEVQEEVPKLYCELEIFVPSHYDIAQVRRYSPQYITLNKKKYDGLTGLTDAYTFGDASGDILNRRWVRKNVQGIHEEPCISGINNYKESLLMYINGIHESNVDRKFKLSSWGGLNQALLQQGGYAKPIVSLDAGINQKAKEIAGDDTSDLSVAKKIFRYVNREFTATDWDNIYLEKTLPKIMSEKSGTPSEINFLLIAMLRHLHYSCSPVITATADKGQPSANFPDIYLYNHVICELRLNGQKYYLDASAKDMPFGSMPLKCYNGYARIIDENDSGSVILATTMVKNKTMCMVTTTNNSITDYTLNYKVYFGEREALAHRRTWIKDSAAIKSYIKGFFKSAGTETIIKDYKISKLEDPDGQLVLEFNIGMKWSDDTMLYYDPFVYKMYRENPFKNPKRKLPIDLPFTQSYIFICKFQPPQGYVVDELPKTSIIKIDDTIQNKNIYEYDKESNLISIDSRVSVPRTGFKVSEYDMLKEFIEKVMEEQQKVIVLKKQA